MRAVFVPQLEELAAALRGGGTETVPAAYAFASPAVPGGRCTLVDRAMNAVAASGDVEFVLPDPSEGRARGLVVKIRAVEEVRPRFSGAAFEGDDPDAFAPVEAGETALVCLTETEPGVVLVARKRISAINQ